MNNFTFALSDDHCTSLDPTPAIPPYEGLVPDFSAFELNNGAPSLKTLHWTYAAKSIAVFSQILHTDLAVPTSAFKLARFQQPRYDKEHHSWIWEYQLRISGSEIYQVKLFATVNRIFHVTWRVCFSNNPAWENFVWLEGTSTISGDSGKWTLYGHRGDPGAWLTTNWIRNDPHNITTTLTIEKEGVYQNSFISYEVNELQPMDKKVTISDTNTLSLIQIDWNSLKKNGRVRNETFFGNDLYHSWDERLCDAK